MVTSEHHQTDFKTQLAVHVYLSICSKMISPIYPDTLLECSWSFSYIYYFMSKRYCNFFSPLVFFPTLQNIYLLIKISILDSSWYPPENNVPKVHILLFISWKKHHFQWTSALTIFNTSFVIFLQSTYLSTWSKISWFELLLVGLVVS